MKKIDIFILKAFIPPFIATFVLTTFVMLMQFMWKYIDELIGKGLGMGVISEFMLYASIMNMPLILPLAILLSSIMTLGNIGENYELVAFKSSGISLLKTIRSLIFFMIIMSVGVFLVSNYVIPIVALKFQTLLFDIRQKQPTMNIVPGQFYNEIDGYSMRIESKDASKNKLYDVLIYDHTSGRGNDQVISANESDMYVTPDTNFMIMKLKNGKRYEEMPTKYKSEQKYEQMRMYFETYEKKFDLSNMKLQRSNEDAFAGHYRMMNVSQLDYVIDTTAKYNEVKRDRISKNLNSNFILLNDSNYTWQKVELSDSIRSSIWKQLYSNNNIKQSAINQARNAKGAYSVLIHDTDISKNEMIKYKLEWHKKFALSFACIVLFFIGAPFGAIIRKGGLGLPMIFSVVFFITYFILNTIFSKLADNGNVSAFLGGWMSSIILLPLGLFFTIKAMNDAPLFNKEFYTQFLQKISERFSKKQNFA